MSETKSYAYLCYVQGGLCRDTHAATINGDGEPIKPPRVLKQRWVQDELALRGITSWCGTAVTFKRTGKNRVADRHEAPYLSNYLFVDIGPNQLFDVVSVDYIAPSMQIVPRNELAGLNAWRDTVDGLYEAAMKIDANSKAAIAEYSQGQAIKAISGPFEHFPIWFERVAKAAGDQWPMIEGRVDVLGAMRKVRFDPLDVRAAG
jgi:hypothetical protein